MALLSLTVQTPSNTSPVIFVLSGDLDWTFTGLLPDSNGLCWTFTRLTRFHQIPPDNVGKCKILKIYPIPVAQSKLLHPSRVISSVRWTRLQRVKATFCVSVFDGCNGLTYVIMFRDICVNNNAQT